MPDFHIEQDFHIKGILPNVNGMENWSLKKNGCIASSAEAKEETATEDETGPDTQVIGAEAATAEI